MKKKEVNNNHDSDEKVENLEPADISARSETDTDKQPVETTEESKENTLLRLLEHDTRLAHVIVDVLAGKNAEETISTYFPPRTTEQSTLEAQLAEAEQRGYLRGRNETVKLEMNERPLWNSDEKPAEQERPNLSIPSILSRIKRSVWDK